MNALDSRYLGPGDTFAQRFTQPGEYKCAVAIHGAAAPPGHDAPYRLRVAKDPGAAPATRYVTVTYAGGTFAADPGSLDINLNDAVLWHCATPGAPGFSVSGHAGHAHFDSAEIHANGMYSHAFGTAGTFDWRDPHDPKTHGSVVVESHPPCRSHAERHAYAQKLGKATLVMIEDGRARPSKVRIAVGQTVFFAVKSASGIAIVEKALADGSPVFLNPQPLPP